MAETTIADRWRVTWFHSNGTVLDTVDCSSAFEASEIADTQHVPGWLTVTIEPVPGVLQ